MKGEVAVIVASLAVALVLLLVIALVLAFVTVLDPVPAHSVAEQALVV